LVCFCLAPLSQTYHIRLSSITTMFATLYYMNTVHRQIAKTDGVY
jgi:hypothetical protein